MFESGLPGSSDIKPSFGANVTFLGSVKIPILWGWQQLQKISGVWGFNTSGTHRFEIETHAVAAAPTTTFPKSTEDGEMPENGVRFEGFGYNIRGCTDIDL